MYATSLYGGVLITIRGELKNRSGHVQLPYYEQLLPYILLKIIITYAYTYCATVRGNAANTNASGLLPQLCQNHRNRGGHFARYPS